LDQNQEKIRCRKKKKISFFEFRALNKVFVGWKQVLAGFNTFLVNLERFPLAKTVADWLKICVEFPYLCQLLETKSQFVKTPNGF